MLAVSFSLLGCIFSLPLTSYVTLGRLFNSSCLSFLILNMKKLFYLFLGLIVCFK